MPELKQINFYDNPDISGTNWILTIKNTYGIRARFYWKKDSPQRKMLYIMHTTYPGLISISKTKFKLTCKYKSGKEVIISHKYIETMELTECHSYRIKPYKKYIKPTKYGHQHDQIIQFRKGIAIRQPDNRFYTKFMTMLSSITLFGLKQFLDYNYWKHSQLNDYELIYENDLNWNIKVIIPIENKCKQWYISNAVERLSEFYSIPQTKVVKILNNKIIREEYSRR